MGPALPLTSPGVNLFLIEAPSMVSYVLDQTLVIYLVFSTDNLISV